MKIAFSFLFLCGCASHIKQVAIDEDFLPYVELFVAESVHHGHPVEIKDLIVMYGPDLDFGTDIGVCTTETDATPVIRIAPRYWAQCTTLDKETLMDHELGHCVLLRDHDATKIKMSNNEIIPKSIMYPDDFDDMIYYNNRDYYLDELFSGD